MLLSIQTHSLDSPQFSIIANFVLCTIVAAMGLAALVIGILDLRRRHARPKKLSYYRNRWSLDPAVDEESFSIAVRALGRIHSWTLIFMGFGIVLWSVFWIQWTLFLDNQPRMAVSMLILAVMMLLNVGLYFWMLYTLYLNRTAGSKGQGRTS
jgi:hypothetical protein